MDPGAGVDGWWVVWLGSGVFGMGLVEEGVGFSFEKREENGDQMGIEYSF